MLCFAANLQARSGILDYSIALGVTSYLQTETAYIAWSAALNGFSYINKMLKRTPAYGEFQVADNIGTMTLVMYVLI